MPSNPLDLPEVLAVVGSFLPLWVNKYPTNPPTDTNVPAYHHHLNNNNHKSSLSFKPATLSRCLQVSSHWHNTLLPILCHGYWSFLMWQLPMEAIVRHCRLFKVLYMARYNFHCARMLLHECTNLVELGIQVGATRDESTGWRLGEGGQHTTVSGLTEKQLLRSNPLIKRLHWSGIGDTTFPVLDQEDFVGLGNLEDLWLENWNCSGGQLRDVLRVVSSTLKSLRLGRIQDVKQDRLQDEDHLGEYRRPDSNVIKNVLRLDRLEWLRSDGDKANVDGLADLVKRSPNLRTLELNVKEAWDFDGLAHGLRTCCPLLTALDIFSALQSVSFKTLLRHCSTTGLRRLHAEVYSNEGNFISDILHHASSLEDLHIRRISYRINGFYYLRLLVECTQLKRFSLQCNFGLFHPNVLDILGKQPWGCRANLQELNFFLEFFRKIQQPHAANKQAFAALLLEFGWEKVRFREREDEWVLVPEFRKVFELVRDQELEALRVLVLDRVAFRRV